MSCLFLVQIPNRVDIRDRCIFCRICSAPEVCFCLRSLPFSDYSMAYARIEKANDRSVLDRNLIRGNASCALDTLGTLKLTLEGLS